MTVSFLDRITSSQNVYLSNFINFINFICIDKDKDAAIHIVACKFLICVAGQNGGAIYFFGKSSSIKKSCFEFCCVINSSIYHYGNAFFTESVIPYEETTAINLTATFGCGIHPKGNSDSTGLVKVNALVNSVNFSKCCNLIGAVLLPR